MLSTAFDPRLSISAQEFDASYNREPFAFEHNLSGSDLFSLSALHRLAKRYTGHADDFFVAAGAPAPDSRFYSVSHSQYAPHEAIERLDTIGQRILLKRPENYDPLFAELQRALFAQVVALLGDRHETPLRLDSSVFITSAAAITPFHFDPEITFFFQIEGAKIYHLFSPRTVSERELEAFYKRGVLDIGQLDLAGRDPARETVYTLGRSLAFHQPENTPHWVETGADLSISYAISLETASTRRRGRARAFNHYARQAGFAPQQPDADTTQDNRKAMVVDLMMPLRKRAAELLRGVTGR